MRAHLLHQAGDHDAAVAHYQIAAEQTASTPEREYLLRKARLAATLSQPRPGSE